MSCYNQPVFCYKVLLSSEVSAFVKIKKCCTGKYVMQYSDWLSASAQLT